MQAAMGEWVHGSREGDKSFYQSYKDIKLMEINFKVIN